MSKIKIPASAKNYKLEIQQFLGADLTNAPSYISKFRSPSCPNMIRESAGKVRKWIGWHTVARYDSRINGFHSFKDQDGEKLLIHAGTKLYSGNTEIYSGMADERSVSAQLNGKLIIADGKKMLAYYKNGRDYVCAPLETIAYVPTVTISRQPNGGGTAYLPVNLLGDKRKDSFLANGKDNVYQLSATGITSVEKAEKLNSSGGWDEITEYTADLVGGKVTFSAPPRESPVAGQDNLIITYSKQNEENTNRINKCTLMTLYGVKGAMDRLFVSGNDMYPNRDWFCRLEDATYWGDLWYGIVGADNSRIMGYSVLGNSLATHIDRSDNYTNIVVRAGTADSEGNPQFPIEQVYRGSGAVSKYAFAPLETEPLFLTDSGIMALTSSDVLGQRYAQLRSYYLNGLLLKQDLSQAVATVYDRFYMLAVGGYLFALDGTQSDTEPNAPYSSRQYEGFYRTNVDARCIANISGVLTFGTPGGKIRQFYTDYTNGECFNDDGEPIHGLWTTPELYGNSFYNKKRFKLIACLIGSAPATGLQIQAVYDGTRERVYHYDTSARYFMYSRLQYSKFTYKTDNTAQFIREKISIKPDGRKVQFVFENNILNEPLSLLQATVEFTQSN